jgi:hypothetical protein
MYASCPNKNLPEWKALEEAFGSEVALREFVKNKYEIPTIETVLKNPFFGKTDKQLKDYILKQSGGRNGFITPAAYITATSINNRLTAYIGKPLFQIVKTNGTDYIIRQIDTIKTDNINLNTNSLSISPTEDKTELVTPDMLLQDIVNYLSDWSKLSENQLSSLAELNINSVDNLSTIKPTDYETIGKLQKIRCS